MNHKRTLKKLTALTMSLLMMVSLSSAIGMRGFAQENNSETKYDDKFFEELKMATVEEELESAGITVKKGANFEDVMSVLESEPTQSLQSSKIIDEVERLYNAEYLYFTLDGDQYSSEHGYMGKAEILEDVMAQENIDFVEENIITPMASTPGSVFGGDTGAFKREQLKFEGFDGIISNVTIPKATITHGSGEQAWVYYGFDPKSGTGIEGGFAFQTGNPRWLPYIRSSASSPAFTYGSTSYANTGTTVVNNFKFYIKNISGGVKATLIHGATNVVAVTETPFSNAALSTMSVKRVTSIAKTGFNGSNIYGKSEGQSWASVAVSKYNSDTYPSWSSFGTYSETIGGKIHGTVNCTDSYIHQSGNYVSIYK